MIDMTLDGRLPWAVAVSLHRVLQGFIYGSLLGIALGLLVGWFRSVEDAVDPLVAAIYPIPKSALFPLFILWFGLGETSKVMTIMIGVLFLVSDQHSHRSKSHRPGPSQGRARPGRKPTPDLHQSSDSGSFTQYFHRPQAGSRHGLDSGLHHRDRSDQSGTRIFALGILSIAFGEAGVRLHDRLRHSRDPRHLATAMARARDVSVEASLKGFRFLVSGFRFKPELGTQNHEPIEGKVHEQNISNSVRFLLLRQSKTCPEARRRISKPVLSLVEVSKIRNGWGLLESWSSLWNVW